MYLRHYVRHRGIQIGLCCLNVLEVFLLIVLTYFYPPNRQTTTALSVQSFGWCVFAISLIFAFDAVLIIFWHRSWQYCASLQCVSSLLSVVPIVTIFLGPSSYSWAFIFSFARLFRLPDVYKASEHGKVSARLEDEGLPVAFELSDLRFYLVRLGVYVVTFFLFSSGFVFILGCYDRNAFVFPGHEDDATSLPFFSCFYFVVISCATVGYGDIYPSNWAAQLLLCLILLTGLTWLPAQLVTFFELTLRRKRYSDEFWPRPGGSFVCILGFADDEFMIAAINELFIAHGRDGFDLDRATSLLLKIVILSPREPTARVASLLLLYKKRIKFIVGTARSTEDLRRAKIHLSECILLLPEKSTCTRREEEDLVFISSLSVIKFLATHCPRETLCRVDTNAHTSNGGSTARPRCLVKLISSARTSLLLNHAGIDCVFRVQEFQYSFLGLSACFPGLLSVVQALRIHQISTVLLPPALRRLPFAQACDVLYTATSGKSILIAIKKAAVVASGGVGSRGSGLGIVINPGGSGSATSSNSTNTSNSNSCNEALSHFHSVFILASSRTLLLAMLDPASWAGRGRPRGPSSYPYRLAAVVPDPPITDSFGDLRVEIDADGVPSGRHEQLELALGVGGGPGPGSVAETKQEQQAQQASAASPLLLSPPLVDAESPLDELLDDEGISNANARNLTRSASGTNNGNARALTRTFSSGDLSEGEGVGSPRTGGASRSVSFLDMVTTGLEPSVKNASPHASASSATSGGNASKVDSPNANVNVEAARGTSFRSLHNLLADPPANHNTSRGAPLGKVTPFVEQQTTNLIGHMVIIYCLGAGVSLFPSHILLPILLLMKNIRRVTNDAVVVLCERTKELTALISEINAQDPSIFANVEIIKGSGRHQDHLFCSGCHTARWIAILAMPQEHMQFDNDYDYDRDVLIVSHSLLYFLATRADGVGVAGTVPRRPFTIVCLHKSENKAFLSFDSDKSSTFRGISLCAAAAATSHSATAAAAAAESVFANASGRNGSQSTANVSASDWDPRGHVFYLSFLDQLFIKCIEDPHLLDLWAWAAIENPHRCFGRYSVPPRTCGQPIEALFRLVFAGAGLIVVALVRASSSAAPDHENANATANASWTPGIHPLLQSAGMIVMAGDEFICLKSC